MRDLLYAYVLALPIGWDSERHEGTAGLRTFPLVAVAACGYMLVGLQVLSSSDGEARVMEGIITGIGFIGGGAILKNIVKGEGFVSGTATAASLWSTGAIGIARVFRRDAQHAQGERRRHSQQRRTDPGELRGDGRVDEPPGEPAQ